MSVRKAYPLRIDPAVFLALKRWADDDLRSVNAQVEFLLARALREAGRHPKSPADGAKDKGGGSGSG